MASKPQTISFKRPTNGPPEKPKPQPAARHTGILQDQLRRAQRRPWVPSFSLAVRILLLVRVSGAMYKNIDDCDEVFNFWEPLHFIEQGTGFQTWELSPAYALRSWAYILLHFLPPRIGTIFVPGDKRAAFFAVRIFLAALSTLTEAALFRAVVERINERVGRYFFFFLLFSAGMWNASASFLPSSFAMYTTAWAFAQAFQPTSAGNWQRVRNATVIFAVGAIVGWPFALALAIPFVWEELFVFGADVVPPQARASWFGKRVTRLVAAGLLAALVVVPAIGIDSLAYGRLSIVPWNIVKYNIFGGSERGPELYGTAPWDYYISNLILNFNYLPVLALLSLPALGISYIIDRKRLGFYTPSANQSSPFTLLALRLAPFYLWFGILTAQPHKEERFMYPAYPLLCFNAAVCVYLARGWLEVAFIKATKSPYRASQSLIFTNFTFSLVVASSAISLMRIVALYKYYHAPLSVSFEFQNTEVPRLLNVSGLLPEYHSTSLHPEDDDTPRIDLTPVKELDLTLCYGKEWHRFPGSYLVPAGVKVEFVKSEFEGLLPRHFEVDQDGRKVLEQVEETMRKGEVDTVRRLARRWWIKPQTAYVPEDLNDLNKEDVRHYVPIEQCDYLVDLDFPLHPSSSPLEPRYAADTDTWDRVVCEPFLDARHSFALTRMFWLPGEQWQARNEFGDYCLLRRKESVEEKVREVRRKAGKI